MTKVDLMNGIIPMLKQYERDNNEIIGCALIFEVNGDAKTLWHGYQFDGKKFNDDKKIQIQVID